MFTICRICAVIFAVGYSLCATGRPMQYQDGDLIFQESRSRQSRAIHEATNSRWSHIGILFERDGRWYVAEGTQPVRYVSLDSFIARGVDRDYQIYRLPDLTDLQRQDLRAEVDKFIGQNYDIFFEWSDDLIYCSELVYKTFLKATGSEIGQVQKYRDLRLDGPYVRNLIRRRITKTGRTLNLDEPIVTPVTQLQDPDLILIERQGP